jgi:polysaccharide export outer membrane protein
MVDDSGDQRDVSGMLKRLGSPLFAIVVAALLPACSLLPESGPKSDAVNGNATAGVRSTAALPYALVDISADTIGFLSQPNLITFRGEFPDKRPKPTQVVGIGDVLNVSIFEAAPGGLFTPGQSAGARPGNFVDLLPQAVDQRAPFMFPTPARYPRQREPYRTFNRPSLLGCGTALSSRRCSSALISSTRASSAF